MLARLSAVLVALTVSACTLKADPYSFSPENVQTLKDAGSDKVRLGAFGRAPGLSESAEIYLRGSSMVSPYGDFTLYLQEAIRQELQEAGRLSTNAATEVSGTLIRHMFDGSGLSVGEGEMHARITVKQAGSLLYDKVHVARIAWPSSFAAAVAIPRAMNEYPNLVHKLVRSLLDDPAFLQAINQTGKPSA